MRVSIALRSAHLILGIVSTFLFVCPLMGQHSDEDYQYKNHSTFLPDISYSPETRLELGGVLLHQFKLPHSGEETRSSNLYLAAIYTVNSQLIIEAKPHVLLPRENWILNGLYSYRYYPQTFWGIGSDTGNEDKWSIEYKQWWLSQAILKKVQPHLFIGPQFRLSRTYQMEFKPGKDNPHIKSNVTGIRPTTTSGLGFIIRWDKRNSLMTPTQNYLVEFSAMIYPGWMGSTYSFSSWKLDLRKYFDLAHNGHSVLAANMITSLTSGNPPFLETAALGGSEIMRGYYKGRYRDNDAVQAQVELRQHLVGRLGFSVFSAAGQVWPNIKSMGFNDIKWAAGGGLRFNLNPNDTSNLRVDIGFGKNVMGYYLTLGEAF